MGCSRSVSTIALRCPIPSVERQWFEKVEATLAATPLLDAIAAMFKGFGRILFTWPLLTRGSGPNVRQEGGACRDLPCKYVSES